MLNITIGFNSLQTGKCIERSCEGCTEASPAFVSIPFKRESASKVIKLDILQRLDRVSIPFKRESASKVHQQGSPQQHSKGFNSLQTGKCIESHQNPCCYPAFKFRFNSLQTGKCIEREINYIRMKMKEREFKFRFNSLQTGKCIES